MGLPRLKKTPFLFLAGLSVASGLFVACATAPAERPGFTDDTLPDGAPATLPDGAPATLPDGAPLPLKDGGATAPDGAPLVLPDGGPIATSRVACGGTFCRADQTCTAGRCAFGCVGTQVPGDYATLSNAVSALSPMGGTICLKAETYSESVSIAGTAGKNLTIVGANSSDTKVNTLTIGTGFDTVTIRGIGGQITANGRSKVEAIGTAGIVYVTPSGPQEVRIDGANLGGTAASPASYGLYVYPQSTSAPKVTVTNSYFHDSTRGVYIYNNYGPSEVSLVNCTFSNNGDAITQLGGSYPPVLTYSNNIFVNQKTFALNLAGPIPQLTHENNLLFGNANNYSGIAADGADYIKADPTLDNSVPPEPRVGSPARRTSVGSRAPATDFYGVARAGGADRGAVQGL
jgi:hypothetical protein